MRLKTFLTTAVLGMAGAVGVRAQVATSSPLYQYNFDSATGVPSVSPPSGGGTLGVTNTGTSSSNFNAAGGISGGSFANTATYGSSFNSGFASTASAGGSTLSGLPAQDGGTTAGNMNAITITFWVNGNLSASSFGRLFILGNGVTDQTTVAYSSDAAAGNPGTSNNVSMELDSSQVDVRVNNQSSGATNKVGNTLANNTWNFLALTYDGTSTLGNNSAVQSTATGGASTADLQLYEGTSGTAVTRFGVAAVIATLSSGTASFSKSPGTIDLGSASLTVMNNGGGARGITGNLDDFRIYSSVLTPTQVEAVRQEGIVSATPEPASAGVLFVSGIMMLGRRRRGRQAV